jgi:hypothetical protein
MHAIAIIDPSNIGGVLDHHLADALELGKQITVSGRDPMRVVERAEQAGCVVYTLVPFDPEQRH